jgi:exonuclease SbcC
MKILAIRGRNLASLAEAFEVNFQAEPLASAGLYAITGPTGSGKSTLLDALCLALYGNTPRLADVGRGNVPDVGSETVSAGDARAILRRGAGEGFAEVDFVGIDGVSYRARWAARRARSRGNGKLQNVEMALTRIVDNQDIGGNLMTDAKNATEGKIGLSFAQFTRAVLLAQNEFAAFLKSDDGDRAELLEMLTGSERFSKLSSRVYQRAKEENDRLAQLHGRLADQLPLPPETRATLDAECGEAISGLTLVEQRRQALEAQLRWHDVWEKAKAAELAAQTEATSALLARDETGQRRQTLQQIDAVQAARPLIEVCRRIGGEVEMASAAEQLARNTLASTTNSARNAEEAVATARNNHAKAEEAHLALLPTLTQARALVVQIESLQPAHETAANNLAEASKVAIATNDALTAKQSELNQAEREQALSVSWLAEHATDKDLAEQWPRWDSLFGQTTPLASELAGMVANMPNLKQQVEQAEQNHTAAIVRQTERESALKAAEATLTQAVEAAACFDPAALVLRRGEQERLRDQLYAATLACRTMVELEQRQAELTTRLGNTQTAQVANAQELAQANEAKPAAEVRMNEADRALRTAETAATESVEAMRAALEPDAPCPVCGATDHPYAVEDPGLRAALSALRANVAAARKALDEINGRVAACKATELTLEHTCRELERDNKVLAVNLDNARRDWAASPVAAEAPEDQGSRAAWLEQQSDAVHSSLTTIVNDELAMHAAQTSKDKAQFSLNDVQRELADALAVASTSQQAYQSALQALDVATSKQQTVSDRLVGLLSELDGAFPGSEWRTGWERNPSNFHETARQQATDWHDQSKRGETLAGQTTSLAIEVKALSERRDMATTQEMTARKVFEQAKSEVGVRREALAKLLDGRTIDNVETESVGKVAESQNALIQRQEESHQANLALASSTATAQQAFERNQSLTTAFSAANSVLANWIKEFNQVRQGDLHLDRPSIEALLTYEADWLSSEREVLHALDLAVGKSEAVLKDRREARVQHESTRPSDLAVDLLREQLATTIAELKTATDRQAALKVQQAQDDERRLRSTAISGEIAAQESTTRTWGQLNDLIGSADGRKFRNIAQQMTLDVLLGYANHHLTSLARRYRLERISDTLGLMIVDQDMGDEVRSVHSLSGGESFLVSLALALGLASLSSQRIKVESLFIDEGFGSLDTDALRIAMEALDGLQSQGRKVGVISHVQEMTERIGAQIRVERMHGGKSRVVCAS